MTEFLKDKREQSEKVYEERKIYYENKLKEAIEISAKQGNRIATVNIQGTNVPFERYLKELNLECIKKSYNCSWVCYTIKW